ncbi:MAG TPA: prepilin peptidase [Phycisphaerales bacterium]|nr:prepilin peptidase [Phycisphaerales bacterium]
MLGMDALQRIELMGQIVAVLFVMAFGACIGSLLNVLVYRLPLGLDVVTPTSRCPSCETYLTWRENIPVFGWLLLRGKCRFCRSPISPEYPLVEAFVAVLWAAVFLVLYAQDGSFLGINFGAVQPEWGKGGFVATWPIFLTVLCLFSCLVAMTLVDAKTCFIPMQLTTTPVVFAVIAHPLAALWVEHRYGKLPYAAPGQVWSMWTPGHQGWWWIGASIGGVAGLVISNILLHKKLIRRSFADYEAWEKEQVEQQRLEAEAAAAATPTLPEGQLENPGPKAGATPHPTDLWIQYPHARREMLKELVFLAPAISLALLGGAVAIRLAGPMEQNGFGGVTFAHQAPLWLVVLSGVFLGYLIGGGIVWLTRILGTLGFGKEAMGLGDVHMMAAVGACIGWTDAVLGFFGAAFVGTLFAILGVIFSGAFKRAMPFGPYLAIGTVLVWFAKPAVEALLSFLAKGPVNLP